MATSSDASRRYSDEEVRLLLKRASELEREGPSLPARTEGPTLADLESIAAEAGIHPSHLRRAARELDTASIGRRSAVPGGYGGFLGAPLALELERVVPGEASTSGLEALIPILQRAADAPGHPSLMGRTLSWQSGDPQNTRTLQGTVSVSRGETRILVEERYGNLAGALFGGIGGGVGGGLGVGGGIGFGVGVLGSALFATVFPLAVIGGALSLARAIFRANVRRRHRVLTRLMEDLARVVEDDVAGGQGRLPEGS